MIKQADEKGLARAVEILHSGGCVGMPTETVYGLAADGLNETAVAQIFTIKQRPTFDPLILHVSGMEMAERVADLSSPLAVRLMQRFWPGALTLVLPRKAVVPDLVTSGLPTVAVRCPAHRVAAALLQAFGGPLAAPSANRFGRISPTCAAAVVEELGEQVPMVLDGGNCDLGIESTIVDCSGPEPVLRRQGAVPEEMLQQQLGELRHGVRGDAIVAPGMLHSHYAPRTPVLLVNGGFATVNEWPQGAVALAWQHAEKRARNCEVLAPNGSDVSAARNFFAALRRLDALDAECILAEMPPQCGLGVAIGDRLQRAAAVDS